MKNVFSNKKLYNSYFKLNFFLAFSKKYKSVSSFLSIKPLYVHNLFICCLIYYYRTTLALYEKLFGALMVFSLS